MMTTDKTLFYWQTNKDWYIVDDEGNVTLTDQAPDEAKESFKRYQQKFNE